MGAAWAATHIWEHYLFTKDKEFLKNYGYPVMREVAMFLSDFLVENPNTGKLVTGPSMSPENIYITPEGEKSFCMYGFGNGFANCLAFVYFLYFSFRRIGYG